VQDRDFIKKLEPLGQDSGYVMGITEKRYASLYRIEKSEGSYNLSCKLKKKFGTDIYDIAAISNQSIKIPEANELDFIAVSCKGTPVSDYVGLIFTMANR